MLRKAHTQPLSVNVPAFLVPSWCYSRAVPSQQYGQFSTSRRQFYPRDMNRKRGVSALRSTGLRQPLSVSKEKLPKPVLDSSRRSKVAVDENHGLWQFFNKEKTVFDTPENTHAHGS